MDYSRIATITQITGLFGTMIYHKWFRTIEVRTLIMCSIMLSIISLFTDYLFVIRWTKAIGINDLVFIYGQLIVFGSVTSAVSLLPIMALFAKIIPK